jgi:hypothetical protein
MTIKLQPFKAGDTFSYAGVCKLPAGNWSARCEVRSVDDVKIADIDVTLGTAVGADTPIALHAGAEDTVAWPIGVHHLDIRYEDVGGIVVHTSTIFLPVIAAVTRA